ncbi:Rtf2 RING-finger-domain-containing protein, partial [Blyttiomyces helicus]
DGGSIPKRDELVKTKKAPERPDARSQLAAAWFSCTLSKAPLERPIVACNLGRLYNREAVLRFLLDRSSFGDGDQLCTHVRSLKDVTILNLTPNPLATQASTSSIIVSTISDKPNVAAFVCPITQREMNGKARFSFISSCGCVVSDAALREVPSKSCIVCTAPFEQDDVVPVNPREEELDGLLARMERIKEKRVAEAEAKKAAKAAKKEAKAKSKVALNTIAAADAGDSDSDETKRKKRKRVAKDSDAAAAIAKRAATEARVNINMPLPNLADRSQLPASMRVQSEAIKSLYAKKDKDGKVIGEKAGNYLTMGTFNRFAAGF